ncbi:hypothetical protein GCM10016455_06210 [Aliiroseovarius zhejiangensis]|uniref:DUF2497 domain-containing protein n=1 Tax=Aliiroseovarius zhejiangensis TaxID=1632025 RepID=A0ABQ3ISP6_9RHOB|nr:hypothetical protein [Aliiroseovarius zhejiangensis]GHE88819.1 hypothetical protein GCM10016455_06210 [Aliiroseovarius zhejiangensis]
MSDPVSNAEIEDVLSSIRRLISESKASDGRENAGKAEKLVLTPAFRVHDSEVTKPATPQTKPNAGRNAASAGGTLPSATADKPADQTDATSSVPVFSHRGYDPARDADADHHPIASRSPQNDEWEADGGDETAQTDVLMFHAARLNAEDEDGSIVGDSRADGWSDDAGKDAGEAPFIAVTDPVDDTPTPNASAPEVLPDRSEPVPAPARAVEIVADDTDIIDEEVVQAMVARLVREELQGEVGEKITQSIRRFVRREIERALTLKGLE